MLSAIVYHSLTGSCKKYAELLSAALHIPAFPLGKEHVKEGGKIIFIGWAFAGTIKGYRKAAEKYDVAAAVLVGMGAVSEGSAGFVREKNGIPASVQVFCLQGAFDLNKLPLPFKLIMKIKCKDIVSRLEAKGTLNEQEKALYTMASTGSGQPASWNVDEIVRWGQGV
ncbi:MAG: hypothetical protein SPI09_09505 [Candidatus Limivicinus sp.]|nr:hypothetical protein [Clostridiales bacterium]MDY6133579.1 hypothetical protein [Candidatus Limivicinus sp.]